VLGEARLLNVDAKESVAAYEKALSLRPTDQTIISVSVWLQQPQSQEPRHRAAGSRVCVTLVFCCLPLPWRDGTTCLLLSVLLQLFFAIIRSVATSAVLTSLVMTCFCHCVFDSLHEQGLVDAYVANSQQAKAVSYLTGLRDKILANAAAAAAGSSSEAAAAAAAAAAADAASSSGDAVAAAGASSSEQQQIEVDPIGVQLLLGEHTDNLQQQCFGLPSDTCLACRKHCCLRRLFTKLDSKPCTDMCDLCSCLPHLRALHAAAVTFTLL
jgi:hypothetical protein